MYAPARPPCTHEHACIERTSTAHAGWFQLADINLDTVGADEYAEWLRHTIGVITYFDEDLGKRRWRPDSDLLERVRIGAGLSNKAFREAASSLISAATSPSPRFSIAFSFVRSLHSFLIVSRIAIRSKTAYTQPHLRTYELCHT